MPIKISVIIIFPNLDLYKFLGVTGPIPKTCTMQTNLRANDLGENQFQDQLPRSLANCMMLEALFVGNNQMDDIFPFWLGALPHLMALILGSNRFHGAMGNWHTNFSVPNL